MLFINSFYEEIRDITVSYYTNIVPGCIKCILIPLFVIFSQLGNNRCVCSKDRDPAGHRKDV